MQSAAFAEALRRLDGLPFIVGGGTALGLYRDGRLIETDTDLDFLIVGHLAEVRLRFQDCPLRYERKFDGRTVSQLGWWVRRYPVDVHFYELDASGETYSSRHRLGRLIFHREAFDRPVVRTTPYGLVPFPGDPERFLTRKYGDDWRIPQYRKKGWFLADDGRLVTRTVL